MRPAMRATLIVLAVVFNAWPWLDATSQRPRFVTSVHAPASAAPYLREEFINADSPHPMSHVASIGELPDGRLVAAWYAGSREGARDVAIYLSTRAPAEARWSMPRAIVTRDSAARELNRYIKKVGNPLLFADSAGKLWLIYVTVSIGGWSGSSLNLTTSTDGGASWTQARRLTLSPFFNLSELVRNAPVALSDAGWAVPIYHELAGTFPEMLWLHETPEGVHAIKSRMSAGWFGYQPAVTPMGADRALALLRDDGVAKTVTLTRTEDAGDTWSRPQSLDLPNPDSGLTATRLMDGRLLLAFNDAANGRENLRLAMSADEGRTWSRVATLAQEPGADFSYPFLMQARSGDVHLVYTWKRQRIKHVVFNVAWLDDDGRRSDDRRSESLR
jgi:predicted neuraminidase